MKLNQYSKVVIVALAAGTLALTGCASKKEVTSSSDSSRASVSSVKKSAAKPSSNSAYFAFDKSELNAAGKATLDAYAAYLNSNSGTAVTVEGNCDERGSREYNLALGQRRADSVKAYLVNQGVSANRIDTVSFGEERPVCKGSGEACWAQNRRADIVSR